MEIKLNKAIITISIFDLALVAKEYDITIKELTEAMQSDLDQWIKENAKWVSKNKELA